MGLDMYLTKRTYVGANYKHRNITGKVEIFNNGTLIDIQFDRVSEIIEEVGYWRKSNAIHKWFVDNVQDGVDDCRCAKVPIEKLEDLRDTIAEIITYNVPPEKILPSQSGFFFGGTEYDELYYEDLKRTREILDDILSKKYSYGTEFFYQSSW